jgi:uncharacterized protein (TIGR02996 family)
VKRNPELEAHLVAHPDDRDAHLVYADWLHAAGDPLGEVISTQIAAEDEPPRKRKVKLRAWKLLDEYIERELVPRFPSITHRLRAWNMDVKDERSPDGITNWSSSQILWRWGLPRHVGMTDWPAPMFAEGLAFLADPVGQFVVNLFLRNTALADATPLASLRGLRDLVLRGTPIADVRPLAALAHLEQLDLAQTRVSDLRPLAKLPSLYKLYLKGTPVTDLGPLASVKTLEFLSLEDTAVTDLEPRMRLERLWEVWLYRSAVDAAAARALESKMATYPKREPRAGLSQIRIVYV